MTMNVNGKSVTLDDNEILKNMSALEITREEAIEMMLEDIDVDHMSMGEVDSDLTEEQKKAVAKAKNTTSSEKKKRQAPERKPDEAKIAIIEDLSEFFEDYGAENVEIVNKSKILTFKLNGRAYKIDLIATRPPKQ